MFYPAPAFAAPVPRPATYAAVRPAPPSPRPVVRAVPADEPERPTHTELRIAPPPDLPRPERLGLRSPRPAASSEPDWNDVHRRLRDLGSISSQLRKLPEGGYRFTCLLPTGRPEEARRVEADAATEGEAVRQALARAEQVR